MISFSVFRQRFTPLLAAALFLAPAIPAVAHEQGIITMTGRGEVSATPDLATIEVGVSTHAKTVAEAISENNAQVAGVFEVLDKAGIDELDRQTEGFNVREQRVYPSDDNDLEEPQIVGYNVSNDLSVRIHDLDRLGEILGALGQNGANNFQGIKFGVSNRVPLELQARKAAAADALAKAQLYADALGITLGDIKSVSENGPVTSSSGFDIPVIEAPVIVEGSSSVPLATGQVNFSSTIHITWAIDQ